MMKIARPLLILTLGALVFGGAAQAQGKPAQGKAAPAQAAPAQAGQQKTQALIQSFRQKTQQLQDIQQKAVKNDPKLAAEMKQFQAEVKKSMLAHGYDVDKGEQRAQAMVTKLKSDKKMSKADRQSTMKSFQAERQKMMTARAAAMQDPQVQKDGKALQANMLAAMQKQDSHTSQLLKDVKSLRTQIMASMAAQREASKHS